MYILPPLMDKVLSEGEIFRGGGIFQGEFDGWEFSGWELSWGVIFLEPYDIQISFQILTSFYGVYIFLRF